MSKLPVTGDGAVGDQVLARREPDRGLGLPSVLREQLRQPKVADPDTLHDSSI